MMLERQIYQKIKDALGYQAAVVLIGPRQVGETTLALEIGKEYDALYLDLEDSHDRHRLTNPELFFEKFEDRLVILDEIHRTPIYLKRCEGSSIRDGASTKEKAGFSC